MPSVHDVAAYILERTGAISTWKLQKLVYYSQAWHLAWEGRPIFTERIEAWANGPVAPDLYAKHRGKFEVSGWKRWGDPSNLRAADKKTIDIIVDSYGSLTGRQLSHVTHNEAPWMDARGDLAPTVPSNAEIPRDSMLAFYSALDANDDLTPVDEADWSDFH